MRRKIRTICILAAALYGCSDAQAPDVRADLSVTREALEGGVPWGAEPVKTVVADTDAASGSLGAAHNGGNFGRRIAAGKFNKNQHGNYNDFLDIVTSQLDPTTFTGELHIYYDHADKSAKYSLLYDPANPSQMDNFGADIAMFRNAGNDRLLVSAPYLNGMRGGLALIYATKSSAGIQKRFSFGDVPNQNPGMRLAVGDVDGDRNLDLVYQSRPLDSNNEWAKAQVGVVLNIMNQDNGVTLNTAASIEGETDSFGTELYVANLTNNSKAQEIVVVDPLYGKVTSEQGDELSPRGAIFFYRYEGDELVQSRSPIVGIANEKGGEQISSVAFADLNGDNYLDLIVGGPMLQGEGGKREGYVHTYINPGKNGRDFLDEGPWSAWGGRSNGRFGSAVLVSDLNKDGSPDLVVGAPGFRKTSNDDNNRQYGTVYVYMGTKDGKAFSKNAFWSYESKVSDTALVDYFGGQLLAADIDNNKGWLDLVVSAEGHSPDKDHMDQGRIAIFTESEGFCYTSERCLVDMQCYDWGNSDSDDACLICDPERDNFAFSEMTCPYEIGMCTTMPYCQAGECVSDPVDDGEYCGATQCLGNTLFVHRCNAGQCVESQSDCGEYVCDPSEDMCPVTCNASCMPGFECIDGKCTGAGNHNPVVVVLNDVQCTQGGTVLVDYTQSYDPDGDTLGVSAVSSDAISNYDANEADMTVTLTCRDDAAPGSYPSELILFDNRGGTGYGKFNITVSEEANNPPILKANDVTCTPGGTAEIDYSRSYDPDGDRVLLSEFTSDAAIFVDNDEERNVMTIRCRDDVDHGAYDGAIRIKDESGNSSVGHITVTVVEKINNAPVVTLDPEIWGVNGDSIAMPFTASDPDGDVLTYDWSFGGAGEFDPSDTSSSPTLHIARDIAPGDYSVTVLVSDGENTTRAESVLHVATARVTFDEPGRGEDAVVVMETGFPIRFSGSAYKNDKVQVLEGDTALCIGTPDARDIWSCEASLPLGCHRLFAETERLRVSSGTERLICHEKLAMKLDKTDGHVYGPKVTFRGVATPNHEVVVVGDYSEALCTGFSDDKFGEWTCDAELAAGSYTVYAEIEEVELRGKDLRITSDPVSFDVEIPSNVTVTFPYEAAVVESDYIVVTGTAAPDAVVNVYVDDKLGCSAVARENGRWACSDMLLAKGEHTLYAAEAGSVGAQTIRFTVAGDIPAPPEIEDITGNLRGGSCSATPARDAGFGWAALAAGLLGLGIVRRRRRTSER